MIYATVNMQIKDKECVCDKQILLYRGDKNVQIRFVLQGNKFMVLENTYAQMIIKRPSAVSLFSEVAPIQNNTVILTISEEMIDEFAELGGYQFQIRLYDDNMNARATLPPCNSCLYIERPIAVENESVVNDARINDSILMAAAYGTEEEVFDYNNDYIRTNWVDGDLITDARMNKIEEALYQINKQAATGGGTGAGSAYISTSLSENTMVSTDNDFDLTIEYNSPNIGHGTLKVFVNDKEALSQRIEQGESTTPIPYSKFAKGENTVVVYVIDRVGVMSNSLTFYVRYGGTELESTFDPYSSYEHGNTIRYYFTPSALDTSKDLYFYMTVDGAQQQPVICKSDERSYFTFSNSLSVGAHKCEAYVTDGESESNKHIFNLVIIDETSIVVATDTYTSTVEEGEQVSIDYKVYSKHQTSFIVKIYVDNTLVNTGTCGLAMNYYKTSSLKEGVHTIRIEAWSNDETVHNYCVSEVEITPSLFEMYQPVNAGSTFIATAQNRSNADENRDKWIGVNQDDESIVATLQEFMFDTNDGWGDDLLTLNGTANVTIPIQPLANNALYGFTLDVTFRSRQIGIPEAEVLTIWDDEKDCGIKITSEELILKSAEGHVCDLYFSDNEMVNAMFVIDRDEKMAKIYLNGVMCEAFALSDYENNGIKYLEDFAIDSEIHINKFGGYCQIQDIRIYEVALGTNEILNNFIATKRTKDEQRYLEEFQKGNTLPTLTIYCDFSGLGKDDKKPCNIVYNSPDELLYGKSFTLEHKTSQLQYQGTSSMAYPIKNYRLNLRDKDGEKWKYNPYSSGQPEARFTLKADFMASGHWQNTGLAKWINDNLYHYDPKDEKSMNPAKWYDLQHGVPMTAHRESINGFPCRLILINDGETPLNEGQYEPTPGNTKDMGIFNFNNDKDNTDTLGFDEDIFPHCASYEVTANSDTSAGAFMSFTKEYSLVATSQPTNVYYSSAAFNFEDYFTPPYVITDAKYAFKIKSANGDLYTIPKNSKVTINELPLVFIQANDTTRGSNTLEFKINGSIVRMDRYSGAVMEVVLGDEDEVEYFKQSFELRFPDADDVGEDYGYLGIEGVDGTGLKRVIDWVDNCTDEEFVRDFEQYFQKQYTLRYYILVIVLGMVDNLGKNMMLDTFDHKVWMPRFYDMDTICSYDNTGQIKFDVDIEMEQGYWNTSASRLWTRIRDLMHDELVEIYKDMRANGMSYESFMSYFYDQQIAKIPQKYYNMDADVKYLPFADAYIGKAHGDGYEHLKRWLKKRLIFTDTLYDYQPSYINDVLTIRANTTEEMTIEIETYTPLYQHVSWYNGQMDKKKIDGKISVTFNGRAQAATDQEVLIYGGSNIKSIKGISSCNPSQLLIGAATRLVELDAKNCTLLSDINSNGANLLPHTYLNKLDLSGCTALPGTLNIQNSPLLRYIDVSGSSITGINMPSTTKNIEYMKFTNCLGLTNVNLSNLYMPRLTSCESMFNGCSNLTSLNLSNWNIPKVVSTNNMFRNCSSLTSLDVREWVTSSVTKMDSMFHDCAALTSLDVSGWDTSNVDNIGSTFNNCRALTSLDLSGWDVSKVTNMYATFRNCSSLTSLDVSGWDASSVANMSFMFDGCSVLTSLDVSDWVIKNVTHAPSMFQNCYKLTSLDLSGWDVSNVIDINRMFNGCSSLTSLDLSGWDVSNVIDMLYMFAKCSVLTTLTANNMTHTNPKLFTDAINNGSITELIAENWKFNGENVSLLDSFNNNMTIQTLNLSGWDTSKVTNMANMFNKCYNLKTLDVSDWDVSKVTDMSYMFAYDSKLTSLDLSEWVTSSATNMNGMFYVCSALTTLDLSGWDTSSVNDMRYMFNNCSALESLDVSGWDTSSVTDMNDMFYNCSALTSLDVSGWDTSSVTNMNYMFAYDSNLTTLTANNMTHTNPKLFTDAINNGYITELIAENWKFNGENVSLADLFRENATIQNLDLKGWDTSSVENMSRMFYNCTALTSLDVSNWDTSSVTSMRNIFTGCSKLSFLDVSNWVTSSVTDMGVMFYGCSALESLDLSEWDTSSVTNMGYMFFACSALTSLDLSGWVTSSVTNMYAMFSGCFKLTSLDVSEWDVSSVTDMTLMFSNCSKLTTLTANNMTHTSPKLFTDAINNGVITELIAENWKFNGENVSLADLFRDNATIQNLDLKGWDTSSVTNMSNMFQNCTALTSLDVSEWDTSSVTAMVNMFYSCTAITSLDVSEWDTSSVTTMVNMFRNCSSLTSLDVSGLVTSNVTTIESIFRYCTSLTSLDVSGWDTSSVTSMGYMFQNCHVLTSLDVSEWDTSSVTTMVNMFSGCTALTSLDVSNWDTSSVENMDYMFQNCSALTSLDLSGWDTSNVKHLGSMFSGCSALISLDLSGWNASAFISTTSMFAGSNELILVKMNRCTAETIERIIPRLPNTPVGDTPPTVRGDVVIDETKLVYNWIYDVLSEMTIMRYISTDSTVVPSFNTGFTSGDYSVVVKDKDGNYEISINRTSDKYPTTFTLQNAGVLDVNFLEFDKTLNDLNSSFRDCTNLTHINTSLLDTSSVTSMRYMFRGCTALTSLDVSGWDTSKVTSMYYMFNNCSALESLDVSEWDTSSVTDMSYMFQNCSALTSLDVSNWVTLSVINMNYMFQSCSALTSLDVSNWVTSSVKDMSYIFQNCSKLTSLDLSNWVTSSVINMNGMFRGCSALTSLDVSGWDTSKVTSMYYMFYECAALTSLDVSEWDVSSVTVMNYMFYGCSALTSLDVSEWDVSSATSIYYMFQNCYALTSLDLSGWDTKNVTNMDFMFRNCFALTSLDLSGWDVSKVISMNNMFSGCTALQELRIDNWPVNATTQTAVSTLPAGDDERNDIYATAVFTIPSGWTLINTSTRTMIIPSDDLDNLTDEEILALTEDGWTIG